jgi:uncharacterized sulfatase
MKLFFPLLLLTITTLLSCQEKVIQKEVKKKPNIIFIISDDQSWGDYSFMGHPHIQTPNIDALAKESATYTRGYVSSPLCGPSLATIISGKYAFQHGQTGNDGGDSGKGPTLWNDKDDEELRAKQFKLSKKQGLNYLYSEQRNELFDVVKEKFYQNKLLTDYLSEAGYRSFQSGKWWLGSWKEGKFDAGMTHGDYKRKGRHGDEGLKIGREGLEPIYNFIEESQKDDTPFFVWYAPFLPHTPHNPPQELLDKYLKVAPSKSVAEYWAMCEWFDQTVGALMLHLKEKSIDDNTLIVYTTDNGWIQSEKHHVYAPRSKRAPHEGGVRTPIMFRFPGTIEPEMDEDNLVSNIDLVPTVLEFLDVNADDLPGINALDKEKSKAREVLFIECYNHDILDVKKPAETVLYKVAINNRWKLMVPNPKMVLREYEKTEEQYMGYYSNKVQLFDLKNDPGEMVNLAEKYPEVVAQMSQQIDQWWQPTE